MAGFKQEYLGPIEYFDGAAGPVTRKIKVIRVIEAATFASLIMQFPVDPPTAGAADPAGNIFAPLFEIWDVASFELTSGSIQVVYHS